MENLSRHRSVVMFKSKRVQKAVKLGTLICFVSVLALCLPQNVFGAQLNLILTTDRSLYSPGGAVVINGNVTFNDAPVSDGLIAIQVNNPHGDMSIIRTIPTGSNSTYAWPIQIENVVPVGNLYGTPSYSFRRGSYAGFNVTISNNYASSRAVLVTVNVFDNNSVPMSAALLYNGTIEAGETKNVFSYPILQIPTDAPLGVGKACVSVLDSRLPDNGGFALAPEATVAFTVITGTLSITSNPAPAKYSTLVEGTGSLFFKIPKVNAKLGNYTVYATAVYYAGLFPYIATGSLQFPVVLVGDFNVDGKVDIKDLAIAAKAYGSSVGPPPSPNWNPIIDLNGDGKIDIKDLAIAAKNYGTSGTY